MKSIYALIAACSLCFVCVACEDDIPDQTHEPQIHKIVGELHDNLSTKSSCANMLEGIESFAGAYDDDDGKDKRRWQRHASTISTRRKKLDRSRTWRRGSQTRATTWLL